MRQMQGHQKHSYGYGMADIIIILYPTVTKGVILLCSFMYLNCKGTIW